MSPLSTIPIPKMDTKYFLTIGSLTSDLYLKPARQKLFHEPEGEFIGFCLGDKVRIKERHERFGGGGANVAVGLSRFGINASVLGVIGDDFVAERILKNLKDEGVDTTYVQVYEGEKSGFSVVLSAESGERTVLFTPGANDCFEDFDETILDRFNGVCLQHLSGCSEHIFNKIAAYFIENPDKFLSWNPGRESLVQGVGAYQNLLPTVDILLVNLEEARLFTKATELDDIFKAFYRAGAQGRIIVSDGRNGSVGCDGENLYFCEVCPDSHRVDTLGAGDSFMSGVVGATLYEKDLPEAMKIATMNAAAVVSYYGAQTGLQPRAALEEVADKIRIETRPFSF